MCSFCVLCAQIAMVCTAVSVVRAIQMNYVSVDNLQRCLADEPTRNVSLLCRLGSAAENKS